MREKERELRERESERVYERERERKKERETSDTCCRESPSAWGTEHKKHVHVSLILNDGKLSPRRATALVALEMIDPKKNPFNCTSKKDVW